MRAYQDMVYSTAMRLLANPAESQDISQEVFLRAYQHFADLEGSSTAGGWLKTVATNLCLNHLSRYRARWRFFSDFFSGEKDEEVDFPAPAPEDVSAETEEQRWHLEQVMQKLPETQRVPLVLYHFHDLSYEEIAARLQVSLSKVKTDIFRARAALRRKLEIALRSAEASAAPKPRVSNAKPKYEVLI